MAIKWTLTVAPLAQRNNKLFKRDSQRVAFLLCVGFSDLGGLWRLWYCVVHPLTGRYTLYEESLKIQVNNLSFQRCVLGFGYQDFPVSILVFSGPWLSLCLPFIGGFLLWC
ncbi:hypothetical protein ACN2MB_004468 [Vibrio parahaemolyticus]|uniref:hypothetical protein n=1 Tax=Vibrio parahaemolyticus TaxID=670 RepID=UPI001124688E|nr:hypothetical protein [Vibrio parahaemolyticus]